MFDRNVAPGINTLLLAGALASGIMALMAEAQPAGSSARNSAPVARTRYQPNRPAKRAGLYYELIWGIDSLEVKSGESGEIVRFSYRVLDANKAKALVDKTIEPSLIDPQAGVRLVVPELPFVGKMRQTAAPETGKSYWVAFSNKGRPVKRGDRVSVVIGQFHADRLIVE